MNKKVNHDIKFTCDICNKYYASKSSLCNHNKKFHNHNNNHNTIIKHPFNNQKTIIEQSLNNPNNQCKFCNKIFSHYNNKWRHQKICKQKNINNEIDKLKESNKQKELELQLAKEESKILQLKLKLQNSTKIDNITLKKLNRLLLERNNLIKNSTINSHNNIQNNIVNNFQLVGFGKEEVVELLTNKDKKLIMNSKYCSLEKLIEIVHCGSYNQFKNIIITNMKDNFMYKYDDSKGQFILSTKHDVLNSLINYRLEDLEVIYNDLLEKNKLDDTTKNCIENFINKINYVDDKFTDIDGKEHDNYKQYKINEIKILLFNNQDKITNDISLLLIANEIEPEIKN
jgi:hypothetical protein